MPDGFGSDGVASCVDADAEAYNSLPICFASRWIILVVVWLPLSLSWGVDSGRNTVTRQNHGMSYRNCACKNMREFILIIIRFANTENNANSENMARSTRSRGAVIARNVFASNAHTQFSHCCVGLCVAYANCYCILLMFEHCVACARRHWRRGRMQNFSKRCRADEINLYLMDARSGRREYVSVCLLRDYHWRHTDAECAGGENSAAECFRYGSARY